MITRTYHHLFVHDLFCPFIDVLPMYISIFGNGVRIDVGMLCIRRRSHLHLDDEMRGWKEEVKAPGQCYMSALGRVAPFKYGFHCFLYLPLYSLWMDLHYQRSRSTIKSP